MRDRLLLEGAFNPDVLCERCPMRDFLPPGEGDVHMRAQNFFMPLRSIDPQPATQSGLNSLQIEFSRGDATGIYFATLPGAPIRTAEDFEARFRQCSAPMPVSETIRKGILWRKTVSQVLKCGAVAVSGT